MVHRYSIGAIVRPLAMTWQLGLLRMNSESAPTAAVHIGYHKTASTWFQQVAFRHHVQVVPVLHDDPFVTQIVGASDSDFDSLTARALFHERAQSMATDGTRLLIVSAERLSGHAASGGYDSFRIASRLHATLPGAKIFWLVRHQADAIRSEYKQIVSMGWPGSLARTLHPLPQIKTVGVDLAYWEYDRLLSRYVELFGRQNIMVIDYGRFTRDQGTVLGELATFLNIDPWSMEQSQLTQRLNVSTLDREVRVRQYLNHFRRTELNPYPPFVFPRRIAEAFTRSFSRLRIRHPLFDETFDQWVEERYRNSNKRLSDEWGVNLTRS